jgi:hypothetical protein
VEELVDGEAEDVALDVAEALDAEVFTSTA